MAGVVSGGFWGSLFPIGYRAITPREVYVDGDKELSTNNVINVIRTWVQQDPEFRPKKKLSDLSYISTFSLEEGKGWAPEIKDPCPQIAFPKDLAGCYAREGRSIDVASRVTPGLMDFYPKIKDSDVLNTKRFVGISIYVPLAYEKVDYCLWHKIKQYAKALFHFLYSFGRNRPAIILGQCRLLTARVAYEKFVDPCANYIENHPYYSCLSIGSKITEKSLNSSHYDRLEGYYQLRISKNGETRQLPIGLQIDKNTQLIAF